MHIALTQRVLIHKGREYDSVERSWYNVLQGHTLAFVPNTVNAIVDADLLIVTGGDNHPVRDQVEQRLIQQFMLEGKPIIGICHGAFLLTKVFGGKVDTVDDHMDTEHVVTCDNKEHIVNSFHTLQIKQAPLQSTILAVSNDNICESWIYKNIGAVVWHPERMERPCWPRQIGDLFYE
jgi:gamma-glutamyl-gamma-aminobutyrate hydrolase PuuD